MSSILGMAINSYEINDIYDVAPENSEFQQAVRRTVPTGHTFKGMRFINDYYGAYWTYWSLIIIKIKIKSRFGLIRNN